MSNGVKLSKPFVREAVRADCTELAATMRQEDVQELWHHSRTCPLDALVNGFEWGSCKTVEWQGRVVAMFGVSGEVHGVGICWMLASDELVKIKKSFLKECSKYVRDMHKDYPVLGNMVWAGNAVHIQWLKWLGFQFQPAVALGADGELFHEFFKVREDV